MIKVFKWLGGTVAAVAGGVTLLAASGGLNAADVEAQSPPTPPARFVGTVMIDGQPAAAGTLIEARVGSATCGSDQVFMSGSEARYVVDVSAQEPGAPNCGTEGATVTFYIGGKLAEQSGTWINYDINTVNLTYTTPTPTPTATTATSTSTVTTTATTATTTGTAVTSTATTRPGGGSTTAPGGNTPRPPSTGTGASTGDESAAWLFALLGAGALAFGVGGAAVARRSR